LASKTADILGMLRITTRAAYTVGLNRDTKAAGFKIRDRVGVGHLYGLTLASNNPVMISISLEGVLISTWIIILPTQYLLALVA